MKNLKAKRTARGWSQQALADRVGMTQAHISRIEKGLHDPSLSACLRLAFALGCEVEDLVSERPDHVPA